MTLHNQARCKPRSNAPVTQGVRSSAQGQQASEVEDVALCHKFAAAVTCLHACCAPGAFSVGFAFGGCCAKEQLEAHFSGPATARNSSCPSPVPYPKMHSTRLQNMQAPGGRPHCLLLPRVVVDHQSPNGSLISWQCSGTVMLSPRSKALLEASSIVLLECSR